MNPLDWSGTGCMGGFRMTPLIFHPEASEVSAAPPAGGPIHILYLIDVLWGVGGAEGVLLRIPKLLPSNRYRCTIGTFRLRPESPVFDQVACPLREFPVKRVFGMGSAAHGARSAGGSSAPSACRWCTRSSNRRTCWAVWWPS